MKDFEQLWLVNSDNEANELIRLGWKFIQIVYEGQEIQQEGWISVKTIGSKAMPKYLMGKPKGVSKKEDGDYTIHYYVKRMEGKK